MNLSEILFKSQLPPKSIPSCDHYAGSEKLMRKSLELQKEYGPIFDITFDCEDGALVGEETKHAELVNELILSPANLFNRIGVRVHDFQSRHFEKDLEIIFKKAAHKIAYVVVPKVESYNELAFAIERINFHAKLSDKKIPVHVLIETQGALIDVFAIAAIPQVECLSFGIMDFVSSHYGAIPSEAMISPAQFTHPLISRAKTQIAAACHAYGKVPSHNVTTEIKNHNVVSSDAYKAASEFGFTRMWSIHPEQINPIVKVMNPKLDEVDLAIEILTEAQKNQWAPIKFNSKLHDRASYRYYWTLLNKALASGMALPDSAQALLK
jgi:citrate lyase subunit beta/citryl-CoA lyase